MRSDPALDEIDLSDPELYAAGNPHAVWTRLRRDAPVFFQRHAHGPGFWAVTRYHDLIALSSDRRLSSAGGQSTTGAPAGADAAVADILVVTDPPKHTQLRGLVNTAFTPRVVARLEPFVQDEITKILDDVAERGSCDIVSDVAGRLPFAVICGLLGVPEDERGPLSHALGHMMETRHHIEGDAVGVEVVRYFRDLIRRADGSDDLVGRLVAAELDGERLSEPEILALCILLFVAGSETTMNAISGGLLAFIEHPDQLDVVRAEPDRWPRAVEEVLRWTSPVLVGMVRTATEPIDVRDVRIGPGDKVTFWYPSANRDEDVFADPFVFDVARDPNPHVAFGTGPHFCLGSSLARLELRLALPEIVRRLGPLELAGPVERLRSNVFHAIERMPVRFGAAAGGG